MEGIIEKLGGIFDATLSPFHILSEGELLSTEEDASYEKCLKGEARLLLTVRDTFGAYWELNSDVTEDGYFYFDLEHWLDPQVNADHITDVTLNR